MAGMDPSLLDYTTVRAIEALTPEFSQHDYELIKRGMQDGTLFPHVTDAASRVRIRNALLSTEGRIVTIGTSADDTLYLEALVCALRRLMPPKSKDSIRTCLRNMYVPKGVSLPDIILETTKGDVRLQGSEETRFICITVQLWLSAMRDFPELTGISPKKAAKLEAGVRENEVFLYEFAKRAQRLGFASKEIDALISRDPYRLMTERVQEEVAPEIDNEVRERYSAHATRFSDSLRELRKQTERRDVVSFSTNEVEQPIGHRSGRPRTLSHATDRKSLYLDCLFAKSGLRKRYATSSAIKIDILRCFLGDALSQLNESGLSSELVGTEVDSAGRDQDATDIADEAVSIEGHEEPRANVRVSESQYSPVSGYHTWIYGGPPHASHRHASSAVVPAETTAPTVALPSSLAGSPGLFVTQSENRKRSYRALVGSPTWSLDTNDFDTAGVPMSEGTGEVEQTDKRLPQGWEQTLNSESRVLYSFLTNELEVFAREDGDFERRVRALHTRGQALCINRGNAVFWATLQDLVKEQQVLVFPMPKAETPPRLCRRDFEQIKRNMRELLDAFESRRQHKRRRTEAGPAAYSVEDFLATVERTVRAFGSTE